MLYLTVSFMTGCRLIAISLGAWPVNRMKWPRTAVAARLIFSIYPAGESWSVAQLVIHALEGDIVRHTYQTALSKPIASK